MIKALFLRILALIVCSAAVVFAEAPAAAPIKVGVILPLSGQYAAIGRVQNPTFIVAVVD